MSYRANFRTHFNRFWAHWTHPEHGWKTTHTIGPICNWLLVGAAVGDAVSKGPEVISMPMTTTLAAYSAVFMRFAWMVQPRNYLLFACHMFNIGAQGYQLARGYKYQESEKKRIAALSPHDRAIALAHKPHDAFEFDPIVAAGVASLALSVAVASPHVKRALLKMNLNETVRKIIESPVGPFSIHFHAPIFKWALSLSNIMDFDRPVEQVSTFQQIALCSTGFVWSRFALVIIPKNYSLFLVNFVLGLTGLYHLGRKGYAEITSSSSKDETMKLINQVDQVVAK